jgi:hypothetical protein
MTAAGLESALQCVRESFAAFLCGDSELYAARWVYPACVHAQGRWQAILNPEACRESNDRHLREAREQGMRDGRILELSARAEGINAAWVDGRFSREGPAGRVISEARLSYLVVRTGDDWRIAVCVVRD